MSQAPKTFDHYMSLLEAAGFDIQKSYDESLGHMLRLHASTRFFGTIMTSGKSALAYVPWLVDGMNMSNKLIVQLDKVDAHLNETIKKEIDSDIRITSHCQDQAMFTADIVEHKLDLVILTEDAMPIIEKWVSLLSETGMMILIANDTTRIEMLEKYKNDYFCYDDKHLTISQKGAQHNKVRRRSKRRKAGELSN